MSAVELRWLDRTRLHLHVGALTYLPVVIRNARVEANRRPTVDGATNWCAAPVEARH
jgi:hypothetical protein